MESVNSTGFRVVSAVSEPHDATTGFNLSWHRGCTIFVTTGFPRRRVEAEMFARNASMILSAILNVTALTACASETVDLDMTSETEH